MIDTLIYGNDTTNNIVNLTLKDEKLFIYTENDSGVNCEILDYTPWVLSPVKLKDRSERLKGNQFYKWITSTTCEKYHELQKEWNRDLWLARNIEECAMLCEGITYHKGMLIKDISILSFDIETSGLVMNEDSCVYLITNVYRKKDKLIKKTFSLENYETPTEMIQDWCAWVREVNPSIITGHNILSYDLPYLQCCSLEPMLLGRDGSVIDFNEKPSKFRKDGSQQYDYHNARITGREIIDTFFLSIKYDQVAKQFPSYGLKAIVKQLGLEKEGRSFIDASRISDYFYDRDINYDAWLKTKQYAEDDAEDALKIFDLMAPSYFYMAQSIPKSFQSMINEASGSHLDALMIRSYLQDGYSQPKTSGSVPFEGAISMGVPGIHDNVHKVDVVSMYPSIMLEYEIYSSEKDPNRHILQLLEYYRTERIKNKKLFKETGDKYYDDLQNSWKILINSLYGFLGASYLLYNYPEGGAAVTRHGREILQKGVEWATGARLEKVVKHIKNQGKENEEIQYEWKLGAKISEGKGFTLTNTDTDSFSFSHTSKFSKEEFKQLIKDLNSNYPEIISWEDDGIYDRVIVLGAKNYVLSKDGETKYKGSATLDQKKEPALTEMLKVMFETLLSGDRTRLIHVYHDYVREARDIKDINRWAVKKTLTKPVLNAVEGDRKNELDIRKAVDETIEKNIVEAVQEGDKVWLYSAIEGQIQAVAKGELVFLKDGSPKMIDNCILRDIRLWDGKDQDVLHYVSRVYKTLEILDTVISMDEFPDYSLKRNQQKLYEL